MKKIYDYFSREIFYPRFILKEFYKTTEGSEVRGDILGQITITGNHPVQVPRIWPYVFWIKYFLKNEIIIINNKGYPLYYVT